MSVKTFKRLQSRWCNCCTCDISNKSTHVVLLRGQIPCDVLFVGEAPGMSEDVFGVPFKGPAGMLLNRTIEEAKLNAEVDLRTAFTNLVGCVPKDEDNRIRPPTKKEITACKQRLEDTIQLCKPSTLTAVGKLAEKSLKVFAEKFAVPLHSITHPAAILRMDQVQRPIIQHRNLVTLIDVFETYLS